MSRPRVILGLMTFGPDAAAGARVTDPAEFARVLDLLQSRGYGEVDTARVYVGGKQEAFTREARWRERGLTLATKVKYPNQDGDNQYAKVIESVGVSLKELGLEEEGVEGGKKLDLLYLHAAVRAVCLSGDDDQEGT